MNMSECRASLCEKLCVCLPHRVHRIASHGTLYVFHPSLRDAATSSGMSGMSAHTCACLCGFGSSVLVCCGLAGQWMRSKTSPVIVSVCSFECGAHKYIRKISAVVCRAVDPPARCLVARAREMQSSGQCGRANEECICVCVLFQAALCSSVCACCWQAHLSHIIYATVWRDKSLVN